jgi:hypothetical protein
MSLRLLSEILWDEHDLEMYMFGTSLLAAPSGGGWSRRPPDTRSLHPAVPSPVCQHTLAPAVHSCQQ